MNKECEYSKFSKKEVEKMMDELTGTKFLDAFAILNHLKASEEENANLKQALIEIREYCNNNVGLNQSQMTGVRDNILRMIDKHERR